MNEYINDLQLKEISDNKLDQEKADYFLVSNSDIGGEFLVSSLWEKVLIKDGNCYKRFIVVNKKGEILITALIISEKILFSSYLYTPRGPIFNNNLNDVEKNYVFNFLVEKLKFKNPKAIFLRIETFKGFSSIYNSLNKRKLIKSANIQPQKTLLINLTKSEEEILAAMHQKTRYNIRLAKRKGVEIVRSENKAKDFKDFWSLMKITGERDSFGIHSSKHYLNLLLSDDSIDLFLAKYNNKVIAAGIFSFYAKRVTYIHGASDNNFRNLMAPHLLQFKVIQTAKEKGFLFYDFYGIDEIKWPGVTRFKKGFSGFEFEYDGIYDLVFSVYLYKFYNFLKKILKTIRRVKTL